MREGFALNFWGLSLFDLYHTFPILLPVLTVVFGLLWFFGRIPKVVFRGGEDGSPEREQFEREYPLKLTVTSLGLLAFGSFFAFIDGGYMALIGAMIPTAFTLTFLISKSRWFLTRKAVLIAYLLGPIPLLMTLLDHIPRTK